MVCWLAADVPFPGSTDAALAVIGYASADGGSLADLVRWWSAAYPLVR